MHLKERPNNVKNGCAASADDSELNTTPDGQVLQVVLSFLFCSRSLLPIILQLV